NPCSIWGVSFSIRLMRGFDHAQQHHEVEVNPSERSVRMEFLQRSPEQPTSARRENSSRELTRIALVLASAALGTVVYFTLKSTHDLYVYRITLLLLFFAISTISGLIFTSKANLTGDLKGFGIAIGGPAALWLIALVIFGWFYPERDLKNIP